MTKAPRVSIIVNVRNGAAYLEDALQSVLAQTFTDWELIVWDNASTDGTREIAQALGPRVRYFHWAQPTTLGLARQAALREARGEWLAFLDHDDVWLPDKLARQIALADDPAVAIVYGRAVSFSAGGVERDFDHTHEFALLPQGDVFDQLFTHSCFIAMSSAMLRRSAVEETGGIPDWIGVVVDYFLYLEIAHRYRARAVEGVVCRYRLHPGSLTHTAARRMHVEVLLLVDRWEGDLQPWIAAKRRSIHATGLAVEEIRAADSRAAGLARLTRDGSWSYLLTRPLARSWRAIRRRLRRPRWRDEEPALGA